MGKKTRENLDGLGNELLGEDLFKDFNKFADGLFNDWLPSLWSTVKSAAKSMWGGLKDIFSSLTTEASKQMGAAAAITTVAVEDQKADSEPKKDYSANVYKSKPRAKAEKLDESLMGRYLELRQTMLDELKPPADSIIPRTPRIAPPEKAKGITRVVVWGDTNGTRLGRDELDSLGDRFKEWNADACLCVGDVEGIRSRVPKGDSAEKWDGIYHKRMKRWEKHLKRQRELIDGPYAIIYGNHDINTAKSRDPEAYDNYDFRPLYEDTLNNHERSDAGDAYKFTIGPATFVAFDVGNNKVSESQFEFFERQCEAAKGPVYLMNHRSFVRHGFGGGLRDNRKDGVKGFERIQKIAEEKLTKQGKAFYMMSGHEHTTTAVGNLFDPGGLGINYSHLPGGKLRSVASAAVMDIDEDGKIVGMYFMSTKSKFKEPIPEEQWKLAWGVG